MKLTVLLAFCSTLPLMVRGAPPIEWQRSFGASQEEFLYVVEQTADAGYILAGNSYSPRGGNKASTNFGYSDYWIVRLDAQGGQLWDKSFGGSGYDDLRAVQQTADGGFILSGGSSSDPGFGSKTSPRYSLANDYWVVRLDPNGNEMWQQSLGGNSDDTSKGVEQTGDLGFLIAGHSISSPMSGSKTSTNFGNTDFWLVRLDADGRKLWDKSYGGAGPDDLWTFKKTRDGGFLLGGTS